MMLAHDLQTGCVEQAVADQGAGLAERQCVAVSVSDLTTGFLHDQGARGDIPGFDTDLPVTIQPPGGELRAYGAGLCSSIGEARYALESDVPERRRFDPLDALRTPYRIDIFQTVYYIIESSAELDELAQHSSLERELVPRRIRLAQLRGDHAAAVDLSREALTEAKKTIMEDWRATQQN